MKPETLAQFLDSTNLRLDASVNDIQELCLDAQRIGAYSVMVYPTSVALAKEVLNGSNIKIGTVSGFPSGRFSSSSKAMEIVEAVKRGANEVDVVANYPELIAGNVSFVEAELTLLARVAHESGAILKVIVETCYLNGSKILDALRICESAGVDFIKTSTGFGSAGANVEHIAFWKKHRDSGIRIKASGGIRDLDDALACIHAGADRLGLSSAVSVVEALRNRGVG